MSWNWWLRRTKSRNRVNGSTRGWRRRLRSYNACRAGARPPPARASFFRRPGVRHPGIRHSADEASMDGYIRSEREEFFEQLCISVDADEAHEQEAIEYFENQFDQADFDPAQWLDIALFYSLAGAPAVVEMVTTDHKARIHSPQR